MDRNNDEEIENTKDKLMEHLGLAKEEEISILGGYFNAHIGETMKFQVYTGSAVF